MKRRSAIAIVFAYAIFCAAVGYFVGSERGRKAVIQSWVTECDDGMTVKRVQS